MPTLAGSEDLALTICDRIVTLIRALPEIDAAKVHFARAYQIQPDEMPYISVEMGPDRPADPDGQASSAFTDSLLQVEIDIYHQGTGESALRNVQKRQALVHKAVMADCTLGLPFVVQAIYGGASGPLADPDQGLQGYVKQAIFVIHYRFNVDDRSIFNTG